MSPQWKRPPLPEETFTDRFGEGEGELLTLAYPKPLPMRLDRWLVSQRTEQSRARIQKFIDCLLYTSPSPRDATLSRMPSSA